LRAQVLPNANGDFSTAMLDAESAYELAPGQPGTTMRLSEVAANAGRHDSALAWATAHQSDDFSPTPLQRRTRAWALLMAGRSEEALAEYQQVGRNCMPCELVALVRTGRMEDAKKLAADIRKNNPYLTVSFMSTAPTGRNPFMVEPQLSAFLEDLRKAGLPETAPP
jgi:hypothetical protein